MTLIFNKIKNSPQVEGYNFPRHLSAPPAEIMVSNCISVNLLS